MYDNGMSLIKNVLRLYSYILQLFCSKIVHA